MLAIGAGLDQWPGKLPKAGAGVLNPSFCFMEEHKMRKLTIFLLLVFTLAAVVVLTAAAVSGAAFTTFNAHVDGAGKDVCKNSVINCNIYGAKEYVWLNGGPAANGLGPDGEYFFAVLEPGGQPNPNDNGPKNLSYNCYPGDDPGVACPDPYTNRTFTVTDGEVSAYAGTHWLDDGISGPKPNGKVPFIRLFPYADTSNPGGVYILAICSLEDGYPVAPRDCKYDAFKVKKGRMEYQFYLSGVKFEDLYADGNRDAGDPVLDGWKILISGTGPDGLAFSDEVYTGAGGFWEWFSPVYTFQGNETPGIVTVKVCEELKSGWTQSFPGGDGCHSFSFTPTGFDSFMDLDFGNYEPVDVTACKVRDADGDLSTENDQTPVAGWPVALTEDGAIVEWQDTLENGCYTWTGLTPGVSYDVHEGSWEGWAALGPTDVVFPWEDAYSGNSLSHTFYNTYFEGCTPGFWQGGPDKPDAKAGGALLWDGDDTSPWEGPFLSPPHVDAQWLASGGAASGNPYIHLTQFNDFFTPYAGLSGFNMFSLVSTGGGSDDFQKAGRSLVAAYLNASWGMNYPYSTADLQAMWDAAVASGDFLSLHKLLDAANNSAVDIDGDGLTEHLCPISAGGNL